MEKENKRINKVRKVQCFKIQKKRHCRKIIEKCQMCGKRGHGEENCYKNRLEYVKMSN